MQPMDYSTADTLHLITTIPLKNRLYIFNHTLDVAEGFSLELFQREKAVASITQQNKTARWSWEVLTQADTILKVSFTPFHLTLQGQLNTGDGYTRSYVIELRLQISNASLFARLYKSGDDPVRLAKKEFDRIVNMNASSLSHGQLSDGYLEQISRGFYANIVQQRCGLTLLEIYHRKLSLDERYAQVRSIEDETMVEAVRRHEEAYLQRISLQEQNPIQSLEDRLAIERDARMADAARLQDTLQQQHSRGHLLHNTFVEGMQTRMQERFDQGWTEEEIAQAALQGQNIVPQLGPVRGGGQMHVIEERSASNKVEDQGEQPLFRPLGNTSATANQLASPINQPGDIPLFRSIKKEASDSGDVVDATFRPIPNSTPVAPQENKLTFAAATTERFPMPAQEGNGQYNVPQIGITLAVLTQQERKELEDTYGPRNDVTFIIRKVNPMGPASSFLLEDDLVKQIKGIDIVNDMALHTVTAGCLSGENISVCVYRWGQLYEVSNITVR